MEIYHIDRAEDWSRCWLKNDCADSDTRNAPRQMEFHFLCIFQLESELALEVIHISDENLD
jgi:hypothetical protein